MTERTVVQLDEALLQELRTIARQRPDRTGWIPQPRTTTLNTVVTLRSLGLIETLAPLAQPSRTAPSTLVKLTAAGLHALAAAPGVGR